MKGFFIWTGPGDYLFVSNIRASPISSYEAPATVNGPVENFLNIDTLATQVMATYTYLNKDKITFRYGAKSGALSSNGSGVRLNSMWFKSFNLAPAVPLPVNMLSFNATFDKKNANLTWSANEENFSHYVLQRSSDGKNYSDVALIMSTGGNAIRNYSYKDVNVTSNTGMVFYRLMLVDNIKEVFRYSAVRTVRLLKDNSEALALSTYPNPVKDQIRVTLPAAFQGKPVMLELYSVNGTRVQSMQIGSASQTETMQIGSQSNGFYLVKATCDDQVAQQRVVKN